MAEASPAVARCKDHPRVVAVARCASCNRVLCDECFGFTMGDRPSCARCAYETATRPQRRFALAVFFVTFVGAMELWGALHYGLWPDQAAALAIGEVVALVVAGFIAASARSARGKEVVRREAEEEPVVIDGAMEGSANPYRVGARRIMLAVSPRVSGKVTALVVVVSLFASAILVPASIRLPRWIEAEIVLSLWWMVLAVTILILLYRGFRLKDDLVYFMPWDRPAVPKEEVGEAGKKARSSGGSSWGDGCSGFSADGCSGVDGEGAIVILGIGLALVVALGAAWLMVEIAMPLAFFVMYSVLMRAIRRAASDRRGCEGDFAKSLGTGLVWATIYVVPVAALTWAVHALER